MSLNEGARINIDCHELTLISTNENESIRTNMNHHASTQINMNNDGSKLIFMD